MWPTIITLWQAGVVMKIWLLEYLHYFIVMLHYQLVKKTQVNLSHICTHSLHMISLSPSDIAACITHLLLHKILNMRLSHQFTNYNSKPFPPNHFFYFDPGWKFLEQTSVNRLNHFFRLLYLFLRKLISRKIFVESCYLHSSLNCPGENPEA